MPVTLHSLRYWERAGKPTQWLLDGLSLTPINLLVGRNASGKTRTMNVIWNLARLFVPEPRYRFANAGYELLFDAGGRELRYSFEIQDGKVLSEVVTEAGVERLRRQPSGEGVIFTREEGRTLRFRPPTDELAAVVRRDSLQHPFLEPLHEWASWVRHYTFGGSMGRDSLAVLLPQGPTANDRDSTQVVGIFHRAERELGPPFLQAVLRDLAQIDYPIESIVVRPSQDVKVMRGDVVSDLHVLGVKERGIEGILEQPQLSQGMFRVLSILIQVNYSQMAKRAHCLLIDDIGEGLDFERSTRLIELLMTKAKESNFQLVMSTNDQFVMNHVPLEHWSVLKRDGGRVRVLNSRNSREAFEQFRFIGLSNFALLEMDYLDGVSSPEEARPAHE